MMGKQTSSFFRHFVVAGILAGLLALVGAGAETVAPTAPQALPALPYHPGAGDSIVVFAAHPDDETLGAGGFIHAAVAAGARVTIVIFTNGDGYVKGVDVGYHTFFSTPSLFIRYGTARQREAVAAAARLGVPSSRVVFLGYPDRGLAVLWGSRWDCRYPYRSPYTHWDRSPYALTLHPESRYCGADVLTDVTALLRRERPRVVILHHPEDTHPDHWAAGAFVTFALESLAVHGEPWARTAQVFHFMVHRGQWPTPQADAPDLPLGPPAVLGLMHPEWWREFSLSPSDEDAKGKAIQEYRTQSQLTRKYLLSFVRRNDLFAVSPALRPSILDPNVSPDDPQAWSTLPSLIHTPAPGPLLRRAEGSAFLDALAVGRSGDQLLLAIRLRRPAIQENQYRIEMRFLYPGSPSNRLVMRFRPPDTLTAHQSWPGDLPLPPGVGARNRGSRIDVVLPLGPIGHPASLYLRLVTIGPLRMVVDHTPWTLVRLLDVGTSLGRR
jgi:LmbE family N-acetylglucosaminyl deacetylase